MHRMRSRLIGVVDALHEDIDAGNTRQATAAVEELSESHRHHPAALGRFPPKIPPMAASSTQPRR